MRNLLAVMVSDPRDLRLFAQLKEEGFIPEDVPVKLRLATPGHEAAPIYVYGDGEPDDVIHSISFTGRVHLRDHRDAPTSQHLTRWLAEQLSAHPKYKWHQFNAHLAETWTQPEYLDLQIARPS
jgi:hypothetical protein